MTPQHFVRKWQPGTPAHALGERAGAQPHFIDLCRALGVPEPAEPERCCFERGLTKTGSGAQIPADLTPEVSARAEAIARAAHRLVALRDAWLNPPEWTERFPEVVPLGMTTSPYPDRIVTRPGFESELAKRTLTNLYNSAQPG